MLDKKRVKISNSKTIPIESKPRKLANFLQNKWVAIGFIVLVSAIIYSNSLRTPFIFDDIVLIVDNPDIKQLSNIKTKPIYPYIKKHESSNKNNPSRPLTYLSFNLESLMS